MFGSQTSPQVSVLLSSLYRLAFSSIQLILIFLAGIFVFGFDVSEMNVVSTVVIFFTSLLNFISFGLISAAAIIVLKKGDPLGWLLTSTSAIFGGAFFPITVMPGFLESISRFVPAKYSLDALRLTIIQGYSLPMVSDQLLVLGLIALVTVPLGIKLFLMSVRRARRTAPSCITDTPCHLVSRITNRYESAPHIFHEAPCLNAYPCHSVHAAATYAASRLSEISKVFPERTEEPLPVLIEEKSDFLEHGEPVHQ